MMDQGKTFFFHVNGLPVAAWYREKDIRDVYLPLLAQYRKLQAEKGRRIIILLAAPPGCGKSTFAAFMEYLSEKTPGTQLQALGMDGFHHANAWLKSHYDASGTPLMSYKGRQDTFDTDKLMQALKDAQSQNIGWPAYSRIAHAPVENAVTVRKDILLIEGNYFLLEEEPWISMRKLADRTLMLKMDEETLKKRLIARKIASGCNEREAEYFYRHSDGINVQTVLHHSAAAEDWIAFDRFNAVCACQIGKDEEQHDENHN